MGYDAARAKLEKAGFFMRATGSNTTYSSSTKAESQSIASGETAPIGTVIDVQFASEVADGWVNAG